MAAAAWWWATGKGDGHDAGGARREGGESCSAVPVRVGAVQKKGVGLSLSAAALDCRSHNNK